MGKLKKTACIAAMLVTMTALLLNTSSEEAVRTINMPEAAEAAPIELCPQIPHQIYCIATILPISGLGETTSPSAISKYCFYVKAQYYYPTAKAEYKR